MIIECIAVGLAGVFVGVIWAGQSIKAQSEENRQLKQELNHLKKVGNLHIGQVVYACKNNGFYMGEIHDIIYKKYSVAIKLDGWGEYFDIKMIYTDKNEALQQIKI